MPGTTARAAPPPMPGNAPDGGLEWSDLHFRPPITRRPPTHWGPAAALFVLLVHVALFTGLLVHRVQLPDVQEVRIEVSYIERVAAPALAAEEADAPATARLSKLAPVRAAKRKPELQAVEVSPREPAPLRLHLAPDPWQQPATPPEQDPLARRPSVRLPGRDEPFVEGVRFTHNTPETVLRSIAIEYFGGVDPDPCPGARQRLANLASNSDRYAIQADLRKVERYCRP